MSSLPSNNSVGVVDPLLLAQDWSKQLMTDADGAAVDDVNDIVSTTTRTTTTTKDDGIVRAICHSLPLLEDDSSVPFVCRYRSDIIFPLTSQQVVRLYHLKRTHASLAPLRTKLLNCITNGNNNNNAESNNDVEALRRRIQTSTSKTELQDLYAPFQPPNKGSILERIRRDHPQLVEVVDTVWNNETKDVPPPPDVASKLQPRHALIHLLATRIAAEPTIGQVVVEEMTKHCLIKTTTTTTSRDDGNGVASKYRNYDNLTCYLVHLRDHQVLAIRRGMKQKVIQMKFDIDGIRMQTVIQRQLGRVRPWICGGGRSRRSWWNTVLDQAIQDAWSRLLRRRGTSRLWSAKCREAEGRAMQVFEDNLRHALLAPPLAIPSYVLALDPGFKAGIKCAILDPNGNVLRFQTVHYLDNKRENGMKQLGELLRSVCTMTGDDANIVVALGNGHGSQEGRALLEATAKRTAIPVDIHLVNEAGASVWSVSPVANQEFPDQPPAAVAAASIGRRLQNPLHELIKVPPRSLGLGMYQHDLSEKELDENLHLTSVDAVATVGIDVNSCSLEILQKVPGLSKLATRIIQARPLSRRNDLLNVSGLGPKTYENCAAFCRVEKGSEALDSTLVHPESYDIARWLMKEFNWNLSKSPTDLPPRREWHNEWNTVLTEASDKFGVSIERVLAVTENLVDSMSGTDPRLRDADVNTIDSSGLLDGCTLLSSELASSASKLEAECPVRGIVGTIRNIADFGAFVDFGGHGDGLLHTSRLGQVNLHALLIGQQIGVDILSTENERVSLGLAGLGLTPERSVAQGQVAGKASKRRKHPTSRERRGGHSNPRKRQRVATNSTRTTRTSSNKRRKHSR